LSFRADIRSAVSEGRFDDLDELIADDRRTVRHLVGLSYSANAETANNAARGVGMAAIHHPSMVEAVIRRLLWAMNDESGTNALSVPAVFEAIAESNPELLLPVVPDMTRLSSDPGLRKGLRRALKTVTERCPGKVGASLTKDLNEIDKWQQEVLDRKARKTR
jgi:hypothetical protein